MPPDVEGLVIQGLSGIATKINATWPDNGLHRRGAPSTGNSDWTVIKSTSGWVLTSGRRYGQWVQPRGVAGKAHGTPPHGFELSRREIPKMISDFVIQLQTSTSRNVSVKKFHPLGRRIEFKMNPSDPEAILVELYKNGVDR
jgi:hypothetical protein